MTMQPRLRALQRLATLYRAVEAMHSIELQRTTAAVRNVQQSIVAEQRISDASRMESGMALQSDDPIGWRGAGVRQRSAVWRRELREKDRLELIVLQDAATEQYVASHMKTEQMKRLQEDIAYGLELERGRRAQAMSDDRFLARRRWKDSSQEQRRLHT